jgi:hypothetical protein
VGERGRWEKNLEREAEAEYIFVSLDSDEKPKKLRRSREEGVKSEKQDKKPLRTRIRFNKSRPSNGRSDGQKQLERRGHRFLGGALRVF